MYSRSRYFQHAYASLMFALTVCIVGGFTILARSEMFNSFTFNTDKKTARMSVEDQLETAFGEMDRMFILGQSNSLPFASVDKRAFYSIDKVPLPGLLGLKKDNIALPLGDELDCNPRVMQDYYTPQGRPAWSESTQSGSGWKVYAMILDASCNSLVSNQWLLAVESYAWSGCSESEFLRRMPHCSIATGRRLLYRAYPRQYKRVGFIAGTAYPKMDLDNQPDPSKGDSENKKQALQYYDFYRFSSKNILFYGNEKANGQWTTLYSAPGQPDLNVQTNVRNRITDAVLTVAGKLIIETPGNLLIRFPNTNRLVNPRNSGLPFTAVDGWDLYPGNVRPLIVGDEVICPGKQVFSKGGPACPNTIQTEYSETYLNLSPYKRITHLSLLSSTGSEASREAYVAALLGNRARSADGTSPVENSSVIENPLDASGTPNWKDPNLFFKARMGAQDFIKIAHCKDLESTGESNGNAGMFSAWNCNSFRRINQPWSRTFVYVKPKAGKSYVLGTGSYSYVTDRSFNDSSDPGVMVANSTDPDQHPLSAQCYVDMPKFSWNGGNDNQLAQFLSKLPVKDPIDTLKSNCVFKNLLDSTIVYVDGDLTITGKAKLGAGIIIVRGNLVIDRAGDPFSSQEIANGDDIIHAQFLVFGNMTVRGQVKIKPRSWMQIMDETVNPKTDDRNALFHQDCIRIVRKSDGNTDVYEPYIDPVSQRDVYSGCRLKKGDGLRNSDGGTGDGSGSGGSVGGPGGGTR